VVTDALDGLLRVPIKLERFSQTRLLTKMKCQLFQVQQEQWTILGAT